MYVRFLYRYTDSVLLILLFLAVSLRSDEHNIQDFRSFMSGTIPVRADGKLVIPEHIQHIKLDIGLSYSAPISQQWLTHEDNVLVFGFEPNPESVRSIVNGAIKQQPFHGEPLDTKFIGTRFFLIPCALGLSDTKTVPFYVTAHDCGCSSMYKPKRLVVEQVIEVPLFPLSAFFELFPFDTHPVIDYIKIDAQGADLDIVKSAGNYLAEHVIYVTLEAEDAHYANTVNSADDIQQYMLSIGFVPYKSVHTSDPTYVNPRFAEYIRQHDVLIYQR